MAANQICVTTYRLEMKAIADISVTLYTIPDVFIITVASDMLNTIQLCNVAIRFFGKEGYTISTGCSGCSRDTVNTF